MREPTASAVSPRVQEVGSLQRTEMLVSEKGEPLHVREVESKSHVIAAAVRGGWRGGWLAMVD